MFKSIQIQTTTKCTRECAWCPNDKLELGRMTLKDYEVIMENLLGINYEGRIHPYLMAEPFCDGRIFYLIQMTRRFFPNNIIFLYTNGDKLTEETVRMAKEAGLDGMAVSVYDSKNEWLPRAACVYPDFMHFMLREDIAHQFFNRGGHVSVACTHPVVTCEFLWKKMYINYKGQAVLCCADYESEVVMGDALEDSLLDIWEGKKYFNYRERHAAKETKELALCKTCNRLIGG